MSIQIQDGIATVTITINVPIQDILSQIQSNNTINVLPSITTQYQSEPKNTDEYTYKAITCYLHDCGMKISNKGFTLIRDALMITIATPDSLHSIGRSIYQVLAEKHNTTPSRVERAIRHSIEGCELYKGKKKPPNRDFLASATDYFILQKGA